MTYEEQLSDIRWLNKRDVILDRDNHECQICLSTELLHVHHKTYFSGRMAWEYADEFLITLCHKCHGLFHGVERHERKYFRVDILQIAERTSKSVAALAALDRQIMMKEATKEKNG